MSTMNQSRVTDTVLTTENGLRLIERITRALARGQEVEVNGVAVSGQYPGANRLHSGGTLEYVYVNATRGHISRYVEVGGPIRIVIK